MDKFTSLSSTLLPINLENVDTDMIIPAQYLKSVSQTGYGKYLFKALCTLYPDFILNNPKYEKAQILISKSNFGCGSSREHAVWSICQYGIKVVVCSSFSDIFFNNAAKNGLLLISMPENIINTWIEASLLEPNIQMDIDLEQQQIKCLDKCYHFDYDPYRKHCLINGQDDLDYLISCNKDIIDYEKKHSHPSR